MIIIELIIVMILLALAFVSVGAFIFIAFWSVVLGSTIYADASQDSMQAFCDKYPYLEQTCA